AKPAGNRLSGRSPIADRDRARAQSRALPLPANLSRARSRPFRLRPSRRRGDPAKIYFRLLSFPKFPRSLARFPGVVEHIEFVRSIHVLPVPVVAVNHEFLVGGQALQRFAFKDQTFLVVEVAIENAAVEDKKTAVQISAKTEFRLLIKFDDVIAFEREFAKPPR